jgi:hypothetical protein
MITQKYEFGVVSSLWLSRTSIDIHAYLIAVCKSPHSSHNEPSPQPSLVYHCTEWLLRRNSKHQTDIRTIYLPRSPTTHALKRS